jgi:hypothetical protein
MPSAVDMMVKKIAEDSKLMSTYRAYLKASNPDFTDEDVDKIVKDLEQQQAKYREQEYRRGQEVTLRAEEIPFPAPVPVEVIPPHVPVSVVGEEQYKKIRRPVQPTAPQPHYLSSVLSSIYKR